MLQRQFKILLIEDNPGDARLMREYLAAGRSCLFSLESADTLARGLQLSSQAGVDLIVLDLGLPDSKGLETFLRVHENAAAVPVLILTGLDDESTAVEALRRGAQDYIVKGELSGAPLVRAIRYAIERDRVLKSGKAAVAGRARVLAFVGAKGGVGTSTIAVNVASALLEANRSVILVEIRPWPGDLSYRLQMPPAGTLEDWEGVAAGGTPRAEAIARLCQLPSGLRVLFGPRDYDSADWAEAKQIEAILRVLRTAADYLILDLLPHPAALARAVLPVCDYLAVVSEPEPVSLACAKALTAPFEGWGIGRHRIGLIAVTRRRTDPLDPDDLRGRSGCEVLGIVPPAPDSFLAAAGPALPVVTACPESDCARALIDLASRLAGEPVISRFV